MGNIIKSGVISLSLLSTLVVGSVGIPQVYAASATTNIEVAKQSVQAFIDAFESGDVNEAVKHVKDTRDNNGVSIQSNYVEYIDQHKKDKSKIKLISIENTNNTLQANIQIEEKGEKYNISLPLIEEKGEWKLFVDGSVSIDKSLETRNVASQNLSSVTDSPSTDNFVLAAEAVPLVRYSFTSVNSRSYSPVYSDKFTVSEERAQLYAWQQSQNAASADITYRVVKKGFFGDSEFSTNWNLSGNYSDGNRQGHNFPGIPNDSGYQIRLTANTSALMNVGGTVYR